MKKQGKALSKSQNFQTEDKVLRLHFLKAFCLVRGIISEKAFAWWAMFHKEKPEYNRNQFGFYTLNQLVSEDHFLRQTIRDIEVNTAFGWFLGLTLDDKVLHIKAAANNHKYRNALVEQQAKFMNDQLELEISLNRKKHAKKSLKPTLKSEAKEKKVPTTTPESDWFHKSDCTDPKKLDNLF